MTVRERVAEIQRKMRDGSPSPEDAREWLSTLTSLLGNCAEEIRYAELAYNHTLMRYLDQEQKANRARILAETSPEYLRKREARDTHELVVEMVRSLKYILRSTEEEMRLSR